MKSSKLLPITALIAAFGSAGWTAYAVWQSGRQIEGLNNGITATNNAMTEERTRVNELLTKLEETTRSRGQSEKSGEGLAGLDSRLKAMEERERDKVLTESMELIGGLAEENVGTPQEASAKEAAMYHANKIKEIGAMRKGSTPESLVEAAFKVARDKKRR